MFGNRGYAAKLLAGLALIAGFGVLAGSRGETINPSIWRCLAEPGRWDGAEIWVPGGRIAAVRDRDYDLSTGDATIRVAGPAPAPRDARISLVAVFHADGPRLDPVRLRPLPAGSLARRIMEAVSIVVFLAVLANFARHFLFRPRLLQAEGRTS